MRTVGRYSVEAVVLSTLRLDGGAMFGSVPKNLWSKYITPDTDNCIPLVSRSLLLRGDNRVILIDAGCGEKWSEKLKSIFAIHATPPSSLPFANNEVTDLILTHLHFDHAGGISRWGQQPVSLELSFPNATIHLQQANYDNARAPSVRERASYLPENVSVLSRASLHLVDGMVEVLPDIVVHRIDGHTEGQQWIEIRGESPIFFPSDLVPTAHHLPLPNIMGYDMCARVSLTERATFLNRAVAENAIVVFQHDSDTCAALLEMDGRGYAQVKKVISDL